MIHIEITPEHLTQMKQVMLSIFVLISCIYALSSIANSTVVYRMWGTYSQDFVRGIAIVLAVLCVGFCIAIHFGLFG